MMERGRNWNHFTIEQLSMRVVKPNPNSYKNLTNQTYAKNMPRQSEREVNARYRSQGRENGYKQEQDTIDFRFTFDW